jgi:C-terminal processing protease CtpA/Prc
LKPTSPRISSRLAFLTDARAISQAESIMGYVADLKLATIIGGRTAGTTGVAISFTLPGGFDVQFTGTRVTKHDGRTPFHLIGVEPNILVAPTLVGIRAGRDEVLEKAMAWAQGK